MRHIILFGAGANGGAAYRFFGDENISAFLDNKKELEGTLYNNKIVLNINDYIEKYRNEQIIITAYRGRFVVARQLEDMNITNYYIAPNMLHNFWSSPHEIVEEYKLQQHSHLYFYGMNPFAEVILDELNKSKTSIAFIKIEDNNGNSFCGCEIVDINSISSGGTIIIVEQYINSELMVKFKSIGCNVINIFDRMERYERKEDIVQFKGIHAGKRAFVIGNGPSLSVNDLDKIYENNDISFGCNSIHKIFDKTRWRPTYYTAVDLAIWNYHKDSLIKLIDPVSQSFIYYWNDEPKKMMKNTHMFSIKDSDEFAFSEDFSLYAYSMMGVAGYMLQLAIYMGITDIYLLGIDISGLDNHFYGKNSDIPIPVDKSYCDFTVERWLKQYDAFAKWSQQHGINIYNATRGGCLESFPRVCFDRLFD